MKMLVFFYTRERDEAIYELFNLEIKNESVMYGYNI